MLFGYFELYKHCIDINDADDYEEHDSTQPSSLTENIRDR